MFYIKINVGQWRKISRLCFLIYYNQLANYRTTFVQPQNNVGKNQADCNRSLTQQITYITARISPT